MLKPIELRRQERIARWLFILVVVAYVLVIGHQALLRYDTFRATAFDLGNMDQVLWNTIHGRLFQFTNQAVDWYGPPTRLAVHFEPILLPLSLLYAFHADPRILLIFQTLALAAGALPVYLLTRKFLREWPLLAALMAAAYLLSPAVLGISIFDFHPVALATPLLLYALLALEYRRYGWFMCACVLAASCKEDVPLTLSILGLFLIWRYRLPRLGIALTLGSILWSYMAWGIIIPHFYPGAQHNNFWYRYESLGSSPGEAIINVIIHPWLLFTTFITLDRFYYLAGLLRSTGFLALLGPEWFLLALPALAENLLSTDSLTYSGIYHYNAAIVPFVMLAAIHGTRRFITLWRYWRAEPPGEFEQASAPLRPARAPAGLARLMAPGSARLAAWLSGRWQRIRVGRFARRLERQAKASLAWLGWQWRRFSERMEPLACGISVMRLQWITFVWITLMIGLNYLLITPLLDGFWAEHEPGSREQHIEQLLARIPPAASVSASENINPHVSERQYLAVFPSISGSVNGTTYMVQYIIVDLNDVFPEDRAKTINELDHLVRSGQYSEIGRAQGVVLLVLRGASG
jgi:uncharacterized membrane protein